MMNIVYPKPCQAPAPREFFMRERQKGKVVEDNHMPMARHGIASVSLFKSAIRGVKPVCDASFWKSRWSHLRFFNHGYLWVTSVIENPETRKTCFHEEVERMGLVAMRFSKRERATMMKTPWSQQSLPPRMMPTR